MTLLEIITKHFVDDTLNDISSPSFIPDGGKPDAETFFEVLSNVAPDYTGLCEGHHIFHNVEVFYHMAFGSLYCAMPDWDTYMRFDGNDANEASAINATRRFQYLLWDTETKNDNGD